MKKFIAIALAVLTAVMVFAFAGCGDKTPDTASDLAAIKEKGKIVVGITDYKPMNYQENGEWVGFDTELTYAFAEKLGVEVEFVVLADWGKKFLDLQAGTVDCVWNGMTITDEALKNSSVSDVYLKNSQVVVLPADKAATLTTVDALKDLTFAVEEGSAGQTAGTDNGLKTVAVKDMATALLEAKSGACDGCIIDKTMADATVGAGTSYADLATAMTLSTEEFGISFRTGSDVTAELNAFLKEYKESGEFKKLADKYGVTVEE
ncbi:MAG: transporter substrate-binding domain-containing protein [Clostridia bacterium]|nr:transporter substrate-binding domain-containing protein [Clostridia bacterium]